MGFSLITIFAYLGAVQLATKDKANALFCSFVAVGLPYVFSIIIQWLNLTAYNLPVLPNLFSLIGIVTVSVQLIASFVVFKKIIDEENYVATVSWAIGGFILIVLLIPYVMQKIL